MNYGAVIFSEKHVFPSRSKTTKQNKRTREENRKSATENLNKQSKAQLLIEGF